jgi:hypothetical protein
VGQAGRVSAVEDECVTLWRPVGPAELELIPASGRGYVTRFRVSNQFLSRYDVHAAGGKAHREYWIPAEDLPLFNAAIVGEIAVIAEFS